MQLEVLDFFFLFWRFIYSSFPHLLQAVTSTSTQRLNVCWICVALSSKISAVEKKKKTPCISVSTFSGTKRNRRRHILLCLNWIWGGFSTSQTVVDFSHLCRAPCCLHNPGHYGFLKKSPQFGAVRLFFFLFFFHRMAKKQRWISWFPFFFFYLEENSANVPWSGWDEEITKQTGGFYKRPKSCSQEPKGKKKKSRKLQQRPGEKKKTWASFKNHKKSDN